MNKLAKITNIILYSFIVICIIIIISLRYNGIEKNGLPVSLGYVYSGSMEPTIRTNDGYILIHAQDYVVNDIITFKPKVLRETYVTHRIIEVMEDHKFRTKGDNNQSTDQEGGEPFVGKEQIIGKAFTIKDTPITIPYLGTLSEKFNAFLFISIVIGNYLAGYVISSFNKRKHAKHKRPRMVYIASYFDRGFIALCVLLFLNAIFIGFTLKSSIPDEISYVVVKTKGLSSPTPGQKFARTISLENKSWLPFVTLLEPENKTIEVTPQKLSLSSNQHYAYSLTIEAPQKVGHYIEKISKITYPDVLPGKWLDFMYSKSRLLPLIVIFFPGILLNIGCYIWWLKRCQLGRRNVMEWMIPLRRLLKG